jgi:predicted CopG family antitoxin
MNFFSFLFKGEALVKSQIFFLEKYFPLIKIAAGVFSFFCFSIIIYIVIKLNLFRKVAEDLKETYSFSDVSEKRVLKAWAQIEKRIKIKGEAEAKLAIIECDRILDEVLKAAGYKGETMAERLEQVTSAQLANIEKIWKAHKIRNRIVHEEGFSMSLEEVEGIVREYKKAFQEFGLLRE